MRPHRFSSGQIALAWVLSLGFHAAAVILIFGGVQFSRGLPGKELDTAVASPEIVNEVAFDVSDPPPRRIRTTPVAPKKNVASAETSKVPDKQSDPPAADPVPSKVNGNGNGRGAAPERIADGESLHSPLRPGKSVVYVLDRSASMGKGGRLAQAVACVRLSIRELTPDTRFQVVVYHSAAETLPIGGGDLVIATSANIAAAEVHLKSLTAEGASEHAIGMRKGLSLQPDALFVLTDADDLRADHLRLVTSLNRGRTCIYPVLFGAPRNGANSPFQALASQNRGSARVIAKGKE